MVKCTVELSEFGVEFRPRPAIKAQVLADFVTELMYGEAGISTLAWSLYVDGSSTLVGSGARIVLEKPLGRQARLRHKVRLVVNQVRGSYEARDDKMAKYFMKAKNMMEKFQEVSRAAIEQQGEIMCADLTPVSWKEEVVRFLTEGIEPENEKDVKNLRRKASHFVMIDGELYKRGFSQPFLKCLTPEKGNYVLRKIHEGICENHIGGKALEGRL
ncbi:UNVERIFIED_CONTAM: hypothetical protein Slati_4598600 [Sesamum latifolium]|uniref:Uncharacterized protein n=1 Tax=Sesamum latifolium TaxID=2727402 RepID=A0AAW2S1Z2_9LAMI